jgi:hypothetical protein
MTKNEIRELAQQAGFIWRYIKEEGLVDGMTAFANLVAQHEREACAKIADTAEPYKSADLIRARGQA